jgi:hypothetical protein
MADLFPTPVLNRCLSCMLSRDVTQGASISCVVVLPLFPKQLSAFGLMLVLLQLITWQARWLSYMCLSAPITTGALNFAFAHQMPRKMRTARSYSGEKPHRQGSTAEKGSEAGSTAARLIQSWRAWHRVDQG